MPEVNKNKTKCVGIYVGLHDTSCTVPTSSNSVLVVPVHFDYDTKAPTLHFYGIQASIYFLSTRLVYMSLNTDI